MTLRSVLMPGGEFVKGATAGTPRVESGGVYSLSSPVANTPRRMCGVSTMTSHGAHREMRICHAAIRTGAVASPPRRQHYRRAVAVLRCCCMRGDGFGAVPCDALYPSTSPRRPVPQPRKSLNSNRVGCTLPCGPATPLQTSSAGAAPEHTDAVARPSHVPSQANGPDLPGAHRVGESVDE